MPELPRRQVGVHPPPPPPPPPPPTHHHTHKKEKNVQAKILSKSTFPSEVGKVL